MLILCDFILGCDAKEDLLVTFGDKFDKIWILAEENELWRLE